MADTALTIITDALVDIGVLADEETPTAQQAAGGLRKLNNMIESWNLDNLLRFGSSSYTIPTVANQGVYTIGPSGDLDIDFPIAFQSAYVRDTTVSAEQVMDYPLYMYNDQEWQSVAFKGMTAAWPNWGVWIDYSYPLMQLHLNPIPTGSQYEIVLWSSGLVGNLTLYQSIILPPGYKRALTANLAIELSGSYGVEVPQTIAMIAHSSLTLIRTQNLQVNELGTRPELQTYRWWDIRTGQYWG